MRCRLWRDHTVAADGWPYVKDLARLGRDLAHVVIVEDNPASALFQPDNALHVQVRCALGGGCACTGAGAAALAALGQKAREGRGATARQACQHATPCFMTALQQ